MTPKSQHMSSFSSLTECHGLNCAREKQRRSIPSLNSSRLCRALRPVKRAHSNHLVPLWEKMRQNNKILKVKRKLGEMTWANEESLFVQSHYFSPVSNVPLGIGNFSLSCPPSSARSAHKITDATFPSLFHSLLHRRSTTPIDARRTQTSDVRGQMRIHIHSISFKESSIPGHLVCAFLPPP